MRYTGWGIIEYLGSTLSYISHGVVATNSKDPLSVRLGIIYEGLRSILNQYKPEQAAIEEIFLNRNPNSTLKLGMARGVVMLAPVHSFIPIAEYGANKIKKSVAGAGHADKTQISQMIKFILPKAGIITNDAADALAIAICHAHHQTIIT